MQHRTIWQIVTQLSFGHLLTLLGVFGIFFLLTFKGSPSFPIREENIKTAQWLCIFSIVLGLGMICIEVLEKKDFITDNLNSDSTDVQPTPPTEVLITEQEWTGFESDSIRINGSDFNCKYRFNIKLRRLRAFNHAYKQESNSTALRNNIKELKNEILAITQTCVE